MKKAIFLIIFFLFLITPGFAREELAYDSVTGLWNYRVKDSLDNLNTGLSGEDLQYDTSNGSWYYGKEDATAQGNPSSDNSELVKSNEYTVANPSKPAPSDKQPIFVTTQSIDLKKLYGQSTPAPSVSSLPEKSSAGLLQTAP